MASLYFQSVLFCLSLFSSEPTVFRSRNKKEQKVHRMAKFAAMIHSPAYLLSHIAATAPS